MVNNERVSSACLIQRNKKAPLLVAQNCEHKFYIGMRNQVGRHGLYSRHYSGVFVAPKNAQNAETKRWSGAVPILLLAILALTTSAYSSLGVLQGLNPRRQLLKVSVPLGHINCEVNSGVRGWRDSFQEDAFSHECIPTMKGRWTSAECRCGHEFIHNDAIDHMSRA